MEPALLLTKTLNSIRAECSKHVSMVDRINTVLVANEFFKSLPDKDRFNLIKQQMEKHNVNLDFVTTYRLHSEDIHGPIPKACQTLWEIINELENKCKPDLTNKKLQILFK
jgi:SAM-dependent MidA family methyltransferase